MADVYLAEQGAPSTPSAGNGVVWIDSSSSSLAWTDDSGRHYTRTANAALAAQSPAANTDVYYTNSDLIIPSFSFQTKTVAMWKISASKNANGTATPIYTVRAGSGKANTDTALLTLTGPAQTAIADIGTLNIMVTCRTAGATGVLQGTAWWDHRGTAANTTTSGTGFANDTTGHVEATSASVDLSSATLAGKFLGISINGGASAAWVVTQVYAEANW